MSLANELRQMADQAITTSPAIIDAFEHVVKYSKARAANGERSCQLDISGHQLSTRQMDALKTRLRNEGLELVHHSGDQRDPRECDWTELKW